MKIIITGASGFIGSHLTNQLIEEHELLTICRTKIDVACQCITMNLNDIDLLTDKYDILIHTAGQAHIKQNNKTRELFVSNNINATKNALRLAQTSNVKHFILVSSIASLSKDTRDIYAQTKRDSESITIEFCKSHKIRYTIIRPVMVYGENDVKGNMNKLIKQLKKGFFPLINNGKTIKNIIYIQNLIYVIKEVISDPSYHDRAINVRDKETLDLKSICEEIEKELGKKVLFIPVPRFACLFLVHAIEFIQMFGILNSVSKESVRKLLVDVNIESENFNFPYSSYEALKITVKHT